ncbi:aminoimidazole riboside kinase [Metabacillus herbersteinensis]|uniref:Aminoimidazole riboside kinase n=1 Tax=Metabacillus herbersteinensis TaxID=283816 RepID=A0ABV6GGS9_9BACI
MKHGIISLGEALIDFIPLDETNLTYQKSPGGAPANVAVGTARLGAKSTFLGKVGNDVLGKFLKETLESYNVNTEHMPLSDEARTGAVFVTLAENGERSFDFYINPSADRFLQEDDIEEALFTENKILHFGSISLISEPARSATKKAVQLAKENGMLVSYDPNLRLGLWESREQAKEVILLMLNQADIVKISEEELEFLTGKHDLDEGLEALRSYQVPVLFVTLGSEGSWAITQNEKINVPAMKVSAIDTTGAGDAFVSGILYSFEQYEGDFSQVTIQELGEMATFASISGGLAASTKGAMTALPTKSEVAAILNQTTSY